MAHGGLFFNTTSFSRSVSSDVVRGSPMSQRLSRHTETSRTYRVIIYKDSIAAVAAPESYLKFMFLYDFGAGVGDTRWTKTSSTARAVTRTHRAQHRTSILIMCTHWHERRRPLWLTQPGRVIGSDPREPRGGKRVRPCSTTICAVLVEFVDHWLSCRAQRGALR